MNNMNKEVGIGKKIGYYCILAIICIVAFLFAKYVVRNNIGWEESPIDTSDRL